MREHPRRIKIFRNCLVALLILVNTIFPLSGQEVPEGFVDELISESLFAPVGVTFIDSSRFYVWEQDGKIHLFENGVKIQPPVLDISKEVSAGGDHGMLGLVLDPDFAENGFVYMSYVVDPHYLRFFGTSDYDSTLVDTWDATIGRVTRYQMDTLDFKKTIADSRTILLGSEIDNGIPVLAPAHGVGGLDFGTDGTLLVGTGDGTTWVGSHAGGTNYKEFGFDSLGKVLQIIDEQQDVGALRSQMLESYSGKILRIDPMTGQGIASNPYFDQSRPDAAISKVWALGLRSPFRLRVRPGSGSNNPENGDPGVIYVGDVGSNQYEEINIINAPGRNLGWPLYEGMQRNTGYYNQWVEHPSYPIGETDDGCIQHYRFNDLLVLPRQDHKKITFHPCDSAREIPDTIPTFVLTLPGLAYGNTVNNPEMAFTPDYDIEGESAPTLIDINHPILQGQPFDGISSVAGDFYNGNSFPQIYHGGYFHGDFSGWIRYLTFDEHAGDELHSVEEFRDGSSVVYVRFNPYEDALYYVVLDYSDRPNVYQLRKISYGGNPRPVAIIRSDTAYGASPLSVSISASESYDPFGEMLSYQWLINGQPYSNAMDTAIQFPDTTSSSYNVIVALEVKDEAGQTSEDSTRISINNTPPAVDITSLPDIFSYPLNQGLLNITLEAMVEDREFAVNELHYEWEIKLKHNDHFHVEFVDTTPTTSIALFALGSTDLDKHSYIVTLTVTDPLGLQGVDEVILEPDLTTSVRDPEIASSDLRLYPNPARDYINLSAFGALQGKATIDLLDLQGRVISRIREDFSVEGDKRIDVSHLEHGMYVIRVRFTTGKGSSSLFCKF